MTWKWFTSRYTAHLEQQIEELKAQNKDLREQVIKLNMALISWYFDSACLASVCACVFSRAPDRMSLNICGALSGRVRFTSRGTNSNEYDLDGSVKSLASFFSHKS